MDQTWAFNQIWQLCCINSSGSHGVLLLDSTKKRHNNATIQWNVDLRQPNFNHILFHRTLKMSDMKGSDAAVDQTQTQKPWNANDGLHATKVILGARSFPGLELASARATAWLQLQQNDSYGGKQTRRPDGAARIKHVTVPCITHMVGVNPTSDMMQESP